MIRIMLTGHRSGNKFNMLESLNGMLEILKNLEYVYSRDSITVVSGGADGADRTWAKAAWIRGIPYEIYVPRGYQEHYGHGGWFSRMLTLASDVVWTQPEGQDFYPGLNFKRNGQMVKAAQFHVIASSIDPKSLVKQKRGGTANCARLIVDKMDYIWLNSLTGDVAYNDIFSQEVLF